MYRFFRKKYKLLIPSNKAKPRNISNHKVVVSGSSAKKLTNVITLKLSRKDKSNTLSNAGSLKKVPATFFFK